MATRNWTGTVSGDWSNASNWDAAPASGDDVIINTGSRNIDAGLSQGALDLNSLWVGPSYTGQIGNSDTAMLTISSAKITIAGGGSQHYITNGNTNIDEFEIIKIGEAGTGHITVGGTIVKLIVRMGHVKVYSGTTTTAYLNADGGLSSSASITHFAGTITTLFKAAGDFTSQDVDDDDEVVNGSGTVTNCYQFSGQSTFGPSSTLTNLFLGSGTVYWTSEATMTIGRIMGGVLDGRYSKYAPTITTLDVLKDAQALFDGSRAATVITTENNYGGSISKS